MKNLVMISLIAALPLVAAPAFAADEVNVAPGLSTVGAPLGLHGADPVALLNGDTMSGEANFAAVHDGTAYYFTSEANKAAFEADPAKYTPQNGGFCSYGVAVGKKFDGDPRHFTVHDGKLFVFLNAATRDAWLEDVVGNRTKADDNWVEIEHVAAADL